MKTKLLKFVMLAGILFGSFVIRALASESDSDDEKKRRAVPLAVPAIYWGLRVAPHVYRALIAAYGLWAVRRAGVRIRQMRQDNRSHNCANNRGWCRETCFSHEYHDRYHSAVCGGWRCCRPRF